MANVRQIVSPFAEHTGEKEKGEVQRCGFREECSVASRAQTRMGWDWDLTKTRLSSPS